jgi:hypothetical protein
MRNNWAALVSIIAALTSTSVNAQTTVTTTGGTANSVPKFSGSSTIVNSAITDSSGNIGIGTGSPNVSLDVENSSTNGQARFTYSGGLGLLINQPSLDGNVSLNVQDNTGLWFDTNNVGRVYINNAGNVGIGTASPGALLEIGKSGTTLGTLRLDGNTSGYVQLNSAAAAGSWTMTLPSSAGTSGNVLQTDGTGVTSWGSFQSSAGRLLCGGSAPPCLSATISYCPYKGNVKTTALYGNYTIPSGTASSGCLTANLTNMYIGGISGQSVSPTPTLYYVYLINVSGTTYLDLETTGHTTDSTTGIEIMSGTNGNKNTLIGMIHTDSNKKVATYGQAITAGDTNTVATWDNRVPTSTKCGFTQARTQTNVTGDTEINTENRCYFMSWNDAAVFTTNMQGSTNTTGANCRSLIWLDGLSAQTISGTDIQNTAGYLMLMLGSSSYVPAEGWHFTTLYGNEQAGSTCTWLGGTGVSIYVYTVQ